MTQASRSLVRHADFLKLWSAETVSQFGTQVSLLAIPFVAATLLGARPRSRSALPGAPSSSCRSSCFSLPAGAWVDQLRRRPILIIGDLGRAISSRLDPGGVRARGTERVAALRGRVHERAA